MDDQALHDVLERIVAVIEILGNKTASLISSGDPSRVMDEEPGSAAIAGGIRGEVRELREQFDRTIGRPGSTRMKL